MIKKFLLLFLILITFSYSEEKKVSIQLLWLDQFEFAGFYVAKEKGFYKDLGLEVELKKYTTNTDIVGNVLNKKADFGTGSSSLLIDKANGKDILLLGSIFQSSPLILLGLKNSSMKTIQDIKDKRIMITKEQKQFVTLTTMLKSQGISTENMEFIKHSFDVDDLINNKTDLMLAYTTNEPFILKEKGYEPFILHPKDYGFDFYEELIFTSGEFAKKNPLIVDNFYEASIKGWDYAFNNIEEIAKLIYEKYNVQNKSLESLIYEGYEMKKLVYTKDGKIGPITEDKIKLIENSYRIMGLIKNDLDIKSLIYKKTIKSNLTEEEKLYLKNKKEITMCIDPDWMPFEKDDKGKHIGMSADYFKIIEQRINIPIKMVHSKTWSESLDLGKKRKCDIFSLIMETPQRLKYLDFTKSYLNIPLVIATNYDAFFVSVFAQLKNKKIGITKDYAYAEFLKIKYPYMNFIDVQNTKDGLDKVDKGDLYGFVGSLASIGYQIQNSYIGQLKIAGKFDDKLELSIGTRNDEPILKSIFNKSISLISVEEHQLILNKWISIDYQQGIQYKTMWKYIAIVVIILLIMGLIYRQQLLKKLNLKLEKKVKEEIEKNTYKNKVLSQQAKMAAMGEMIGNIAHQWRQPLSAISITATGLKIQSEMNVLDHSEMIKSLDNINHTTQYLSKTIDDFRNYYKDDKEKTLVNISDILNKSLKIISPQFISNDIEIISDIKKLETFAFQNELVQVFINILNNAKDALINLNQDRYIFIDAYAQDNNIVIHIKDNAGGISEEIISRIFEPYFTTKHKYQGTGIGLYMTEEIIVKHLEGSIQALNEEFTYKKISYKGANFKISLPITKS